MTVEAVPVVAEPDDFPVDLANVGRDVGLAQMAVRVHRLQEWPTGAYCSNCRFRWPCRLYRWGAAVLSALGWSEERITACAATVAGGESL